LLNPSINKILFSVKMLFAENVCNFSLIRKIIKLRLKNKLFSFSGIKKKNQLKENWLFSKISRTGILRTS